MKNNLFKRILFIGIFTIGGALAVKSQAVLKGRYIYEGRGENPSAFSLTFEGANSVYYSYFHNGAGTIEGSWTQVEGVIRVVLARGAAKWTLDLKTKGDDLEIAETLPAMTLPDVPEFKTVLPAGTLLKKDISQPNAPELSVAEIGNRVMNLIKSIKTSEDISPENIARQTGLKVFFNEKNRREYGFGGNVKESNAWTYGLIAYPYPSADNKQTDTLRFSFDYRFHALSNAEMPPSFQSFNLEQLSKELQTAGFSAPKPRYGNHDRLLGWNFSRGNVQINVSTRSDLKEADLKPVADNYIVMIVISFLNS